ncbi:MAG: ABC transporter permease [Ilumatobacteraceae bacterium]
MANVLRQLRHVVVVLFIVTFLTFILIDLLPGDPAVTLIGDTAQPEQIEAVRAELGLDDPVYVRYVSWLGDVAQGDLGRSFRTSQPVSDSLAQRIPVSLELMALAQIISLVIAVPLGIYSAYRPGRFVDRSSMTTGFGMIAMPPFVAALLLILMFASWLGWLPSSGYVRLSENPLGNLETMFLPALTLAVGQIAVYQQLLRADMIATLQEDYVMMAKSKGLPTWHILLRHALRPSSFSLITLAGVNMGRLISGAVIVEVIFAIPGIGQGLVQSIYNRDFIILQGMLLFTATAYVLVNLAVDLLYAVLDPRARRAET